MKSPLNFFSGRSFCQKFYYAMPSKKTIYTRKDLQSKQ